MIKTRKELAFYLQADRMMNRGSFKCSVKEKLRNVIFPDHIMNYLIHMRKADYYANRSGAFYKVMSNYHRCFREKLGLNWGSVYLRMFLVWSGYSSLRNYCSGGR